MKILLVFGLILTLCSACDAREPLSVRDSLLGVDRYAGKEILLMACFKGNREGAYIVDCSDESFSMAFEASNQFKKDEDMMKDFYRCVYQASAPKPKKGTSVILLGSIRKGEESGYPPYFVANGVYKMCKSHTQK